MKYLIFSLKLTFATVLVYLALRNIDFAVSLKLISSQYGVLILLLCTSIVIVQSLLAGLRVKYLISIFDYKIKTIDGIRNIFLGNFFAQTTISLIGSDAMRIYYLTRAGIKTDISARVILLDRILGAFGLKILFLMIMPFLYTIIFDNSIWIAITTMGIASAVVIVLCLGLAMLPQTYIKNITLQRIWSYISISRHLYSYKLLSMLMLILSMFLHFCNILTIYLCMQMLDQNVSLFQCLIIGTPVMLLSLLPISIGGWGVREGSMIIGFGLLGISADIALTVSIIVGISSLLGSLPGIFVIVRKNDTKYIRNDFAAQETLI